MRLSLKPAAVSDAPALANLHTAVADHLTGRHGTGPWSSHTSEKGVLLAMRQSRVYVVDSGTTLVATFRLATKKPWAIDPAYFTPVKQPLYLLAMAVTPEKQRKGIGKWCIDAAVQSAKELSGDVIRLDAYDAKAGAGEFYARCGFAERGRVTYRNAPLVYYELLLARQQITVADNR